ncbi:MAG: hypothetical protein ACRDRU_29415 [Pseudonocardiaceae bacterium]
MSDLGPGPEQELSCGVKLRATATHACYPRAKLLNVIVLALRLRWS